LKSSTYEMPIKKSHCPDLVRIEKRRKGDSERRDSGAMHRSKRRDEGVAISHMPDSKNENSHGVYEARTADMREGWGGNSARMGRKHHDPKFMARRSIGNCCREEKTKGGQNRARLFERCVCAVKKEGGCGSSLPPRGGGPKKTSRKGSLR